MDRKYWDEHYFEFEKTFGGRYFEIQIRDLISKRPTSIERPRLTSKNNKWEVIVIKLKANINMIINSDIFLLILN